MKKKYLISTDEAQTDALKGWLESHGDTFSGFVNRHILQYLDVVNNALRWPDGIHEMTLIDIRELAERLIIEKLRVISRKKKRKRAA